MNNVYGPRQYPEKMIPKFLLAAKESQAITIQGSGRQKRSMLYVEDAAEAIYTVLMNADVNSIYNIPSKDEFSVLEVADTILKLTEAESVVLYTEDRPFNDTRYWIHDDRLERFGWTQRTPFEEGLKKTKDWYYSIEPAIYWTTK
jgi:UDP-glucose 4,6-dehydratase